MKNKKVTKLIYLFNHHIVALSLIGGIDENHLKTFNFYKIPVYCIT